jgi:hypothetical protein
MKSPAEIKQQISRKRKSNLTYWGCHVFITKYLRAGIWGIIQLWVCVVLGLNSAGVPDFQAASHPRMLGSIRYCYCI